MALAATAGLKVGGAQLSLKLAAMCCILTGVAYTPLPSMSMLWHHPQGALCQSIELVKQEMAVIWPGVVEEEGGDMAKAEMVAPSVDYYSRQIEK
jgi:hypothetical protein